MIKLRISDFPGMRPTSHNVDEIILVDYTGNVRQVIKADNVNWEIWAGTRKQTKQLLILEEAPQKSPGPELKVPLMLGVFIFIVGMVFHRLLTL